MIEDLNLRQYASDEEVNHFQQTDHDSFTIVYRDCKVFAKCDTCGDEFECVGREYSKVYRESDQPDRTDPGYWLDNF